MQADDRSKAYTVRAAHCDHHASEADVHRVLERITAPLERAWARLEAASCIAVKVNLVWPPERIRRVDGRNQELVDEVVFRGVLRLLRRRTRARIVVADTTLMATGPRAGEDVHFRPLLEEFGVEYVECNDPPFTIFEVPGGGLMFRRYALHACLREADAVVSVATLKTHNFMGVTLCAKNLFGLCPIHPDHRPRSYFHHIIRLPYVLADLARILQPDLNIIDGLVGQSIREWGGEARISNTLVAGDHPIATDMCAATLMGNDPTADWPTPPFRRDRNHLLAAAESGFGPRDPGEVDFQHDLLPPVAQFDSEATDSSERVANWRRSMCEQALYYLDHEAELSAEYAGQYIYLQDGQVLAHGPSALTGLSRRDMSGARKDSAIWLKYVDPDDLEEERYEVYRRELARIGGVARSA